jgi:transcriptional regulator with GAF, ATPase, and Fis domain
MDFCKISTGGNHLFGKQTVPNDNLDKHQKDLTPASKTQETVERDHIVRVLGQTQWKVSGKNRSAEILGINRSTLRARMGKCDI